MGGRERLDRWLEDRLRLRHGERAPTAFLFLGCFASVGAFLVSRAARDALYLARFSTEGLPWLYVGSAAATALAGAAFTRVAARARPEEIGPVLGVALAASLVAFRLALDGAGPWVLAALWVWVEIAGTLAVIQFWNVANDVHDARAARRLFAWIAAGGAAADLVLGGAVAGASSRAGPAGLLVLAALLHAAAGFLPSAASARAHPALARARPRPRGPLRGAGLLRSPYLRAIAGLTFLGFLAITFVDYQFKAAAARRFGADGQAMAGFFGAFHVVAGAAALAVQLLLTGRVLERLGVGASLSILPAAVGGGSLLAALVPGLGSAAVAKGADHAVRYTVTESASQLLYMPLAPGRRQEAKAFVDGVVRPVTVALAGVALAAWAPPAGAAAALAAAGFAALWLAGLARLEPEYLRSLRQGLRSPPRSPGALPAAEVGAIRSALSSRDPAAAEVALDLAGACGVRLGHDAAPLLSHASPRLRARACAYLARVGERRLSMAVLERIEDVDPEVRVAAARAFAALARGEELRAVEPLLVHPEASVRAEGAAALVRGGEPAGARAGRAVLESLAAGDEPSDREHVARAIALAGTPQLVPLLQTLLEDPSAPVRRAALRSAATLRAPDLVPALVRALADRRTSETAAEALGSYGPGIEGALRDVLRDPHAPPDVRRAVPLALGRLGTPAAAAALAEHLDEPDARLRRAVDRALAAVARAQPEVPLDRDRLRRACLVEIEKGYRALAAAEALALDAAPPVGAPAAGGATRTALGLALAERADRAGRRSAGLVALLSPDASLDPVLLALDGESPAHRAGALEILDHVLEPRLKRLLVPLLDGRSRAARLREVSAVLRLPRRPGKAWLAALAADEDDWIAAAALHHAAATVTALPAAGLTALIDHPSPAVREAALVAAGRLLPQAVWRVACRQAAGDPHPTVRALARRMGAGLEVTG
jgi:AAA family ATP:ADP antiporter